jgi:hypothetical protein
MSDDERYFVTEQEGDFGWFPVHSPASWWQTLADHDRHAATGRPTRLAEVTADNDHLRVITPSEIIDGRLPKQRPA